MANDKDFKVKNGIQPTVYHEGVGTVTSGSVTVGYDLSVAAYDNKSFAFTSQEGDPRAVGFDSTGTTMIVGGGGSSGSNSVYQYTLSTAWDVSTASYASKSFNAEVNGEGDPTNYYFKADGTKFYMVGITTDRVYEFDMSTAWDLSTASYTTNQNFNPALGNLQGVAFKSDGTKMYLVAQTGYTIHQYSLSTAWDVTTASADSVTFAAGTAKVGMWFNSTGTLLWMANLAPDEVVEYNLSTAWDISTASASGTTFDISSQDTQIHSVAVKTDGTKMYIVGNDNNSVYQYSISSTTTTNTLDLSTGSVFEITPTSDIQINLSNPAASGTVSAATLLLDGAVGSSYDLAGASFASAFSVASQENTPASLAFKTDGTKMYVIGSAGDNVNEYALSTAWDILTASFTTNFSVSSQSINSNSITFKTDGTSFYITDNNNYGYQYDMSTAWDVSTASYASKSHDFTSQAATPYSIKFKTDGTKMYIANAGTDDFYQYSLSTAWDISTGSYDSVTFAATDAGADCRAVEFKSDGTKMYIVSNTNDAVYQYSLSTAWDISSASYDSVNFSVTSQETVPTCVVFGNSGANMYVAGIGNASDNVLQYSTGSAATITYDTSLQFGGGTAPDSPAIGETDVLTFSTRDGGTTYQAAIAIDGAA